MTGISGDGHYLVYTSQGTLAGTTTALTEAWRYDTTTKVNLRVSADDLGGQANANVSSAVMSDDGNVVVFTSAATNLAGLTFCEAGPNPVSP